MDPAPASAERIAMERLGWRVRDLYLASLAYGTVGQEEDLRRHLQTGDHLDPAQRAVAAAALNDALMERGDEFRIRDP